MASPNTNHPLVGRRVLNVHRQDTRNPEAHRGKIEGIYKGCNALDAIIMTQSYSAILFIISMSFLSTVVLVPSFCWSFPDKP